MAEKLEHARTDGVAARPREHRGAAARPRGHTLARERAGAPMKIVDLSMTVSDWDKNSFAPEETYFKLRPIVKWEDKGFVSNMVEMTVHAGTHIDSPHHFYRDMPSVEQIPIESFVGEAIVVDLTFKGTANARITPEDLEQAERALREKGIEIK